MENIIGKLNINEVYTLHEVKAPKNYEAVDDILFKINEDGQLMLYAGIDYQEISDNKMIVIDKDKIINPTTNNPIHIIVFSIIIILSIGVYVLWPKKYSSN